MEAKSITFDGRTLHGEDGLCRWVASGMEGWFDSPEIKGETVDRSNADGEFDLPIFNQARLITLSGTVHTRSHTEQHAAMNRVTSVMKGVLEVAGHGPKQQANAKRASAVRFSPATSTLAQWQLRLKAVDPRKFGPERRYPLLVNTDTTQTQDAAMVRQYGNYSGFVVAEIRGDFPGGYTLLGPEGREFRVTAPLLPGQLHRVDFSEGILQIDGVYTSGYVPVADVWAIPADTGITIQLVPLTTGAGSADLFVRDTYI